ncbi:hypothetical protein ACFSQ3_01060 [Sphingobacterium corticis]|uniref:HK97 gp10 family phage protein n=1 Tax=Sphingobacterium corticis TaxID=1812823 RepID=A0ABW5NG56_9SPHI
MAIKGLSSLKANFARKHKGYRNATRHASRLVGNNVENAAKLNAPVKIDSLIYGEVVSDQNGYGYAIRVKAMPGSGMMKNMPIYLEFGTGLYAASYVPTLPKEWQEVAKQFYINGKGKTKVHSFLYPAWNTHSTRFKEAVRSGLRSVR